LRGEPTNLIPVTLAPPIGVVIAGGMLKRDEKDESDLVEIARNGQEWLTIPVKFKSKDRRELESTSRLDETMRRTVPSTVASSFRTSR
jgi:hypothetical protein